MMFRNLLTVSALVSAMGLAELASAQVAAEKSAPAFSLFPNGRASVQLRHYTFRAVETESSDVMNYVQARAFLGSTFFDGKIDSTLILATTKRPQTTQVTVRRPQLYTTIAALSTDNFTVTPWVNMYLPHKGSGTIGYTGVESVAKAPVETTIGTFKFSGSANLWTIVGSRPEDAKVKIEDGRAPEAYGLTAAQPGSDVAVRKNGKQDMDIVTQYNTGVEYSKGKFSSQLTVWLTNAYLPRYTVANGETDVSYPVQTETAERLRLKYKITDKLSMINDAYLFHDGVWESERRGYRETGGGHFLGDATSQFMNLAYLDYTL
jgi:hypothetical protein